MRPAAAAAAEAAAAAYEPVQNIKSAPVYRGDLNNRYVANGIFLRHSARKCVHFEDSYLPKVYS